jgi:hypothetical protein
MLVYDKSTLSELFGSSNCRCISAAVPAVTLSAGMQQQTYWQANVHCIIAGNHWLTWYVQVVFMLTAFALTFFPRI